MLDPSGWRQGKVAQMDEAEGAIYVPPKAGLPFLVVTFAAGEMSAKPTSTRSEARILLSRERSRRAKLSGRQNEVAETAAKRP